MKRFRLERESETRGARWKGGLKAIPLDWDTSRGGGVFPWGQAGNGQAALDKKAKPSLSGISLEGTGRIKEKGNGKR